MLLIPHHATCALPHPARRHLLQPTRPHDISSRLSALGNGSSRKNARVSTFWYGGALPPFHTQYEMRRTMAFALANETTKEEEEEEDDTCTECGSKSRRNVERVSLPPTSQFIVCK